MLNSISAPIETDDAAPTDEAHTAHEPTETVEAGDSTPAEEVNAAESGDDSEESEHDTQPTGRRRVNWSRVVALGILPGLALSLALAAAYLKWQDSTIRDAQVAGIESAQVARDSTIALLSYRPDTVDKQLTSARNLLSGSFKDSYTSLTNDVVIPGAKQKQISAVATVPAVASVSATESHSVALVFVNQTTIVGSGAPTDTASVVRVTMDKVDGHWLITNFEPI